MLVTLYYHNKVNKPFVRDKQTNKKSIKLISPSVFNSNLQIKKPQLESDIF